MSLIETDKQMFTGPIDDIEMYEESGGCPKCAGQLFNIPAQSGPCHSGDFSNSCSEHYWCSECDARFVERANESPECEPDRHATITTTHSHGLEIGDLIAMNGRLHRIVDAGSLTTLTIQRIRWWHWPLIWLRRWWRKAGHFRIRIWYRIGLAKGYMKEIMENQRTDRQ